MKFMKFPAAKRTVRVIAGASLAATAGLATAVLPAAAGSNGQHVQVCANYGAYYQISMWGTDQNGNFAQTPATQMSYEQRGCVYFGNYWFKGNCTIRLWKRSGGYDEKHVYIPVSQGADTVYYNF
jgi:hypothetical protein